MNNPDSWSDVEPYQVQSNEPDAWSDVEPYEMPQAKQQESFQDPLSSLAHAGSRLGMIAGKGLALAQPAVFIPEIAGQALHAHYSSPSVQSANFRMNALEAAEHLEVQKAHGKWSDKDEERLQEFYKMGGMQNEEIEAAGGFHEVPNLSPTSLFKEAGKKIGIDTEARNILEKGTEFAFMLATGRPEAAVLKAESYLPSNFNKVFTPAIKKHVKDAIKTAPIIVPSAIAEEATGVPMEVYMIGLGLGKAAIELGANLVPEIVSKTGKNWFKFNPLNLRFKDFNASVKEELARRPQYTLEQVIKNLDAKDLESLKPFLDKAIEMGIPLTPATLKNSKYFRNMEKLVTENEMTAAEATEFRQKVAKSWADLTEKSLKDMQTDLEFSTPGSTAEALLSDVTRQQHKKLVSDYTQLYEESAEELKRSENINIGSYREIEDSINAVRDKIGDTLFPTTAQTSAKQLGKEAKNRLTTSSTEAGLPELSQVRMTTGKQAKGKQIGQAAEKVKESVKEAARQKRKLEKAKSRAQRKKTKPAKERAQAKVAEIEKEAEQAKKSVTETFEESHGKVVKAGETQKQTFLKSQEDLEDFFGEAAKYMKLGENGQIRIVKPINGQTLVNTIKSLNSIIDWENPGIVNLYSHTRGVMKDILKRQYGKSNPNAVKKIEEANLKFGQTQNLFGKQSKWKKWGIDSESTSEELLRTINSIDKLKQFEKDFGNTVKGKLYIDHLKHLKAKEMLDPIFSQRNYTPGDVSSGLDKLKRDPFFRHIVPEKTWNNLEAISNLDALIEQRSSKFFKQHHLKEEKEIWFPNVRGFFHKMFYKYTKDLSQDRRAQAFAEFFLDPAYTKKSRDLMMTIADEMKKPKPDIGLIKKSKALLGNIFNEVSQIAKVTAIENIPESE